jgi:hypothetical protein
MDSGKKKSVIDCIPDVECGVALGNQARKFTREMRQMHKEHMEDIKILLNTIVTLTNSKLRDDQKQIVREGMAKFSAHAAICKARIA